MEQILKNDILKGSIWTIIGQITSLFLGLAANMWLARLLSSHEFGQIGIIVFFISIASVLTEGGLSGALIRKPNVTENDYSTIFVFNLFISFICFIIILIIANKIAVFYNDLSLTLLLQVSSTVLIVNAFQIVHNTRLMVEMRYHRKALYDIISSLLGAILGISAAYIGCGVWSLVIMFLTSSAIKSILLWSLEKIKIKISFYKSSFKELFSFGINTTLSSVLTVLFDNIYQLILGKTFSISQVGYYYQAKRLSDTIGNSFISISSGPVFSGLAKVQGDKNQFASSYNRINSFMLTILAFSLIIFFCYSDIIVTLVYGKEWLNSSLYLKYLSVTTYFLIQEYFNRVIYKTFNKTRTILLLDILKKGIQIISIVIGIKLKNIDLLLIGFIIANALGYIINYVVSLKIINSSINKEFINAIRIFIISLITVLVFVSLENLLGISGYHKLSLLLFIIPFYFTLVVLTDKFFIHSIKNIRDVF